MPEGPPAGGTSARRRSAEGGAELSRLVADAAAVGVALDDRQAEALLRFRDLLLRWNRAFNLVSRRDTHRLLVRHLLDSLSIAPYLRGSRVLDLGTGAGLPGVPLAIARGDVSFTLVDRSERKIRFLHQVVRSLGLSNVRAWCGDVRALPAETPFDTVVCRAVAGVTQVWALAGERLHPGGCMLIMHRSRSAGEPEEPGDLPGGRLRERKHLCIPGREEPHELLVIERTADGEPRAGETGDRA